MGLFALDIPESEKIDVGNQRIDRTRAMAVRISEMHCSKVEIVDRDICSNLEPGVAHFIFTTSRINSITFIEWILKHYGHIDEIVISTYSISSRTVALFDKYFRDGLIQKAGFIVCGHMKRLNEPRVQELESMCRNLNIGLHYRDNHSKILLAAVGQDRICLMGSGNFAENSHNEQYLLISDGRVFDFYRKALLED